MILFKIIIWGIIAYQMGTIVATSFMFKQIRESVISKSIFFGRLLHCVLCLGVWFGIIMSIFVWSPSQYIFGESKYVNIFTDAMLSSFFSYTIQIIEMRMLLKKQQYPIDTGSL